MNIEQEREKYRKKNKMDYVKAIKLLHEDGSIFDIIYDITRIHIPKIVYKYMALNKNKKLNDLKFNTILDNKIFLSYPKNLNDPFEANTFFIVRNYLER